MRTVRVDYEESDGCWVATSPDLPGYRALADGLPELRSMVFDGLPFFVDEDEVDIREQIPSLAAPVVVMDGVRMTYADVTITGPTPRERTRPDATRHYGNIDYHPVPSKGQPSQYEDVLA